MCKTKGSFAENETASGSTNFRRKTKIQPVNFEREIIRMHVQIYVRCLRQIQTCHDAIQSIYVQNRSTGSEVKKYPELRKDRRVCHSEEIVEYSGRAMLHGLRVLEIGAERNVVQPAESARRTEERAVFRKNLRATRNRRAPSADHNTTGQTGYSNFRPRSSLKERSLREGEGRMVGKEMQRERQSRKEMKEDRGSHAVE